MSKATANGVKYLSLWFLTSESDITNIRTDHILLQQLAVLTFKPSKISVHIWHFIWREGFCGTIQWSRERDGWYCMAYAQIAYCSFKPTLIRFMETSLYFSPDSVHGNSVKIIGRILRVCISHCRVVKQPVRNYKRWQMISKVYAVCLVFTRVCVCVCVSTCMTGVPSAYCWFSDFHMSELVFMLRVQHVGVLFISYCLRYDIILMNGQRQTGRMVW